MAWDSKADTNENDCLQRRRLSRFLASTSTSDLLMRGTCECLGVTTSLACNLGLKSLTIVIEKFLKLGLILVATRTLGTVQWGQFAFAQAVSVTLVQFVDFGLGTYIAREVARERGHARELYAQALGLKLLLALGYIAIISALVGGFVEDSTLRLFLITSGITILSQSFVEFFGRAFQGMQRFEWEMLIVGGFAIFTSGIPAVVLISGGGAATWAILQAGMALTSAAAAGLFVFYQAFPVRPALNGRGWSSLLKTSGPIGMGALLSVGYYRAGVLFTKLFLGDEAAGFYSAAFHVVDMLRVIPAVVVGAVFPVISRRVQAPRVATTGALLLLVLGLATGLGCALFPGPVIITVCGTNFERGEAVLRVLGFAIPFILVNFALTHYLIARDLQNHYLFFCLFALMITLAISPLLVESYGLIGGGLCTLVTEAGLTAVCLMALLGQAKRKYETT